MKKKDGKIFLPSSPNSRFHRLTFSLPLTLPLIFHFLSQFLNTNIEICAKGKHEWKLNWHFSPRTFPLCIFSLSLTVSLAAIISCHYHLTHANKRGPRKKKSSVKLLYFFSHSIFLPQNFY